jgi:hypothetical protein
MASNCHEAQGKLLKVELGETASAFFARPSSEALGAQQVHDKLKAPCILDKRHK